MLLHEAIHFFFKRNATELNDFGFGPQTTLLAQFFSDGYSIISKYTFFNGLFGCLAMILLINISITHWTGKVAISKNRVLVGVDLGYQLHYIS